MARRFAALCAAMFLGLTIVGNASAEQLGEISVTRGPKTADQSNYLFDVPLKSTAGYNRGGIDTTWWGNAKVGGHGGPAAVLDGTWDFEGSPFGTLQGWTSEDLTDLAAQIGVIPIRRVTSATFGPSDTDATMNGAGSVWFGALDAETQPGCWPGGQGYSNSWGMNMSKSFTWGGSGDVTIAMDYFTDSETQFDYSYVYVVNSAGTKTPPLNSSVNGRPDDGLGWSGAIQEGTSIGSPSTPANESMTVDSSVFNVIQGPEFEVIINSDSDPLYSDGLDSFAGFLNSVNGPLGVDDITVSGVALNDVSDFNTDADGWTFFIDPPIGVQMKVEALGNLDPVGDACACPLTGNVLVAADLTIGQLPHPKKQNESMKSSPADVSAFQGSDRLILFDIWEDLPTSNGVGFRIAMDYFPWTCPITSTVGWTIEPLDQGGGFAFDTSFGGPICSTFITNNTVGMPASGLDSIKVVFEVLGDCDDFGTENCTGPAQTNQSPYWDNIRLGAAGSGSAAPTIAADVIYQDVFPAANSLLPNATADIHSFNDGNRADMDQTNANMGDSATVVVGSPTEPLVEAYMNFRVFPGPGTNQGNAWFGKYGGDFIADAASGPGDNWAKARMDTAEVGGGSQVILGSYASYDWPAGQEAMAAAFPNSTGQKIIRDGVLTPGSTVQYFFSSNFTITPAEQAFLPDTTDETYFEFEVLPGYFELNTADEGSTVLAPCLLYVDAFNAGAQVPLEDQALRNLFGQVTDTGGLVHDNWDRYDYIAASSNTPGPLAREANGDNGMTGYQSMIYKTILYNTGTFQQEGLRDGDAGLLANFLTSDDFNRPSIDKGLWLSGDNMGRILSRPTRPKSNTLLGNFATASLNCNIYRDAGCTAAASGDSSECVRLDESSGADFSQTAPYAARGNGCPTLREFDVFDESGDGQGNLSYIDQDAGLTETQYASISNDQLGTANPYAVVIDGVSVHHLRTVPAAWTGSSCGTDSTAVLTRTSDVMNFLNADFSPGTCDPAPLIIGVEGGESSSPVASTRLFQNSPNPFNPTTTVRYQLHDQALVKLQIFDVSGKLVRTLVDQVQGVGEYSIKWDGTTDGGRDVSSGVYWARMNTTLGFQGSTKMVVLK